MRSVIYKAAGGAPDSAVIDARAGEGAIIERKQVARGAPPVSRRAERAQSNHQARSASERRSAFQ